MATNLQKLKYTGRAKPARPDALAGQSSSKDRNDSPPTSPQQSDMDVLKADILLDLRANISTIIKSELRNSLA